MNMVQATQTNGKEAWIEPAIEELHVSETAAKPGAGGDGGLVYGDCTKS